MKLKLVCLSVAIAGCGTGLPQRDLRSSEAPSRGYFVSNEEVRARGGVGHHVPRICSDGGWGAPAANCIRHTLIKADVPKNIEAVITGAQ